MHSLYCVHVFTLTVVCCESTCSKCGEFEQQRACNLPGQGEHSHTSFMRHPHTCLLTIVCHGHQIQAPLLAWLACIRHSRRLQGSLSPHAVNFTLCSDHMNAGLGPSSPVIPHAASFRRLAAAAKVVQRLIRAALWRRKKKKAAIAIQVNKHTLYRSKPSADFQPVTCPTTNSASIEACMCVGSVPCTS